MVGSLCRSRKYPIPVMLYKYKYQIRMSEFELPDPLYPSPTEFKSVHAVFYGKTYSPTHHLHLLSHRRNDARLSILYRFFHGKCSYGFQSFVPPALTLTPKTRLTTSRVLNHSHSMRVPLVRNNFHSVSLFPSSTILWNRLPRGYFPPKYNLNLFKFKVKHFLHILIRFTHTSSFYAHILPLIQ